MFNSYVGLPEDPEASFAKTSQLEQLDLPF